MIEVLPWIGPVSGLAALVYAIWSNRSKARDQRVEALEVAVRLKADTVEIADIAERVDKLEDRATKVESEIVHSPTRGDVTELALTVTELAGKVETLSASLKPLTAMAGRIQEAMIDKVMK